MSKLEYQIVSSEDPAEFERVVNYELELGWTCLGGVSVCPKQNGDPVLYQALVLSDNPDD